MRQAQTTPKRDRKHPDSHRAKLQASKQTFSNLWPSSQMEYIGNNLRDFLTTNGHAALKRVGSNYVLRTFTEKEIEQLTSGYRILLGKGAFGEVYKGMLDGKRPVAVKRYKNGTCKEEFAREVIVHSKINHKNVVRLLGCCTEENALMIIMEFICNGNLENLLHSSKANDHIPLPLDKRLDIAIMTLKY
ncbi:hypothetical protein BAE44_0006567 [Dichanthelium oligosanthes]|uniref:Protein kinase domain-containing protein n=1 Tax=Dichanthelium oligosanthes TaxID=888268 RepID=A0A1E5W4S6_9POAL|nr:hypothetical protein BAE44_0006567 [Dichanthelium oligosanthes]